MIEQQALNHFIWILQSWKDQKFSIKTKAAKCDSSASDKPPYKLTDLEERVVKLISPYNPRVYREGINHGVVKKPNIQRSSNDVQCVPTEIGPTSCIIISLDTANAPVTLDPSNLSLSKLDSVNLLTGLESRNVIPVRLESAGNLPVRLETTNSASVNSISMSNLAQNARDIPLRVETTADSLEIETEKVQESTEKEKNSSLMVKLKPLAAVPETVSEEVRKPEGIAKTDGQKQKNTLESKIRANSIILQRKYEAQKSRLRMRRLWKLRKVPTVLSQCMPINNASTEQLLKAKSRIPENSGIIPGSEDVQELVLTEITEGNVKDSSNQNSSSNPPKKKLKVSNHSYFRRKNDLEMVKLLQRQNVLLKGIAGSLARIEKSLNDESSREVQRKNNTLINISEKFEKLAESLGAVSKSLKSEVEK